MNITLVTPSYRPDLERCNQLVESVGEHVSGLDQHILLIDDEDMAVFKHLAGEGVSLIRKEDILPSWVSRMRWHQGWWWSKKTLPVRGWIMQQVAKLGIAEHLDTDVIVFADSDVSFVRPFDAGSLVRDSGSGEPQVRLYRDERKPHFYQNRRYRNWYRFAARALGLGNPDALSGAYIAQMVSWDRHSVIDMHRHIEQHTGLCWQAAVMRSLDFSEYVLYGAYVENVAAESRRHFFDPSLICHSSWYHDIKDQASLERYLESIGNEHCAVHIQSNLGFDLKDYTIPASL
ncbi:MAG: DUF6492 family protein [Pseudomonadota bacterium]